MFRPTRYALLLLLLIYGVASYPKADTHCSGPTALINIVNRPSLADSPCVVNPKHLVMESGYLYQTLIIPGHAHSLPFTALRLGLPAQTEVFTLLPLYTLASPLPGSGVGPVSFGAKHELVDGKNWLFSLDGYITPPSGNRNLGTSGWGAYISGVGTYELSEQFSLVGQLWFSTTTNPPLFGGLRYSSINPDLLLAWQARPDLQIYGEVYGQTHTGFRQSHGFITDVGLIYLVNPHLTVDIEAAQRLSGFIFGTERYVGAGFAILL